MKLFRLFLLAVILTACNPAPQESAPTPAKLSPTLPPTVAPQVTAAPRDPTRAAAATAASPKITPQRAAPGGSLVTYVLSEGIGDIAVLITQPQFARFVDGAGIIVHISTFFTGTGGFITSPDFTTLGLVQISYLWPGQQDKRGAKSGGVFDYGGEDSLRALRDVLRFASGQIPDVDGNFIQDLLSVPALTDQVGLYAFSHPGIAATNVLALYGDQLPGVRYFVGRENPTQDLLSTVELGHFDAQQQVFYNPLYRYPGSYSATEITINYSSIRWDAQLRQDGSDYMSYPYFDLNGNGSRDASDYTLGYRVPTMWDKRYYSTALLQGLRLFGGLDAQNWPSGLATPEEAEEAWKLRSTVGWYGELKTKAPDLKVLLVFAQQDHVQPAADKPHIHQAFDGFFHTAGLWVRLNPDQVYVAALAQNLAKVYVDHPANSEPADWAQIGAWAYANQKQLTQIVPLAAVAEMADRLHDNRWDDDLAAVLAIK